VVRGTWDFIRCLAAVACGRKILAPSHSVELAEHVFELLVSTQCRYSNVLPLRASSVS
jgi:hypothetical protein